MLRHGTAILLLACLGFGLDAVGDAPYKQTPSIVYAETDGIGLLMDVFAPVEPGPAKGFGLVLVVSGAWKSDRGIEDAHVKLGFFDVLCRRGYTVFGIRPGSLSAFTAPQMLDHVQTGLRYVKAHAGDYGIDAGRLGLIGASAGGHLALMTATHPEPATPDSEDPLERFSTEVKDVAVFCPPTDFLDWNGTKYGLNLMEGKLVFREGLAHKGAEEIEEAAKAISPVYSVRPGLPPFLLIHGDADSVVPHQQSQRFVEAVHKTGGSAELLVKPGGDHSWPTIREEIEKMADWLDAQLGVAVKPA